MDHPSDLTVVVTEFPTAAQAKAGFEDLHNWVYGGNRNISVYRLSTDGEARLVVAVVLTESGHEYPVVRRLKRCGGVLSNLPVGAKKELVERALVAMEGGLSTWQHGMNRPLGEPSFDPNAN